MSTVRSKERPPEHGDARPDAGPPSASEPGAPPTLDDHLTLDVGDLRRHGWLRPGYAGWLRWLGNGKIVSRVRIAVSPDAITLSYRVRRRGSQGWQEVTEAIDLLRSAQALGWAQERLRCPGCGRPCTVLYGRQRFRCRRCVGVAQAERRDGPA